MFRCCWHLENLACGWPVAVWYSVTVWHCGSVPVWYCGSVTVWYCGSVTVWYCGTVTVWYCGSVVLCGSVARQGKVTNSQCWPRVPLHPQLSSCSTKSYSFSFIFEVTGHISNLLHKLSKKAEGQQQHVVCTHMVSPFLSNQVWWLTMSGQTKPQSSINENKSKSFDKITFDQFKQIKHHLCKPFVSGQAWWFEPR